VNSFEKAMNSIAGGKVLDIATQEGHFIRLLMNNLKSYTEIVGIDVNEKSIEIAVDTFGDEKVQFMVMNAEKLGFEDNSFDTVSISASFHHLSNIRLVLNEIKRVLKLGGNLIIMEMHRDGQTEAQLSSIYLHHWVAAVDTAQGHVHKRTLARQEIINYVESLRLSNVEYYDVVDSDSNPMERSKLNQLGSLIDGAIHRIEEANANNELKKRGQELRYRLYEVGAQKEPILVVLGKR
jgi:SAM-dependent methyltransferase